MPRQFKTARKMCKLKLLEAAEKLGVSQPTLSSWEAGRKSPTIDSVLKMAELYKVSTDFLLGNTANDSVQLNENEKSDIQKVRFQFRNIKMESFGAVKFQSFLHLCHFNRIS